MRNTVTLVSILYFLLISVSCKGKQTPSTDNFSIPSIEEDNIQLTVNESETLGVEQPVHDVLITKDTKPTEALLDQDEPQVSVIKEKSETHVEQLSTSTVSEIPKTPDTIMETKVIKSPEIEDPKKMEEEKKEVPKEVSHDTWNQLLTKYVSASGKVNYKGFKSENGKFQSYLDLLAANPPQADWSRNKIRAYWINAYNAFTVKIILDNYPLKSIMDLGKPWDKAFIKIGGKDYTLNDIEHKILRAKYFDSRIHFAVNCASFSCPKLLNKAFTEANVSSQMGSLASIYINDPKHNKITPEKAELSQLFEWYKGDFTKKGSLIEYINKYSKTKLNPDAEISFMPYNWTLNE